MKGMTIIAESGATKTDWVCGGVSLRTRGINLSVMTDADVSAVVAEAAGKLLASCPGMDAGTLRQGGVSRVFFYGAGLVSEDSGRRLRRILTEHFGPAAMEFSSDLMASARALWGMSPGVVAILGTGSNCCVYDGEKIVMSVRPGGFILGDEGGGVSLGRLFIADYIKNLVPEGLAREFHEEYGLDYPKIVEAVYRGSNPSGFLASFAPFIVKAAERYGYAHDLLKENFRSFITRALLSCRSGDGDMEVGVSGSFGCACRTLLEELGGEYGVRFVKFVPSPIKILPGFHENYNFAPLQK